MSRLDFTELSLDLIKEINQSGITKIQIARWLGISRQALDIRMKKGRFNTEDLTILATKSIVLCGGSVMLEYLDSDHFEVIIKPINGKKEK